MSKTSNKQDTRNLSTNVKFLAGHFRSYGLLSKLLGCSSKFVSRAITSPNELSLESTKCASDSLGISNDILLGDCRKFKVSVSKWIKMKQKFIEDKKKGKKRWKKNLV